MTLVPPLAIPVLRPRCCLRYLVRFGINMAGPRFLHLLTSLPSRPRPRPARCSRARRRRPPTSASIGSVPASGSSARTGSAAMSSDTGSSSVTIGGCPVAEAVTSSMTTSRSSSYCDWASSGAMRRSSSSRLLGSRRLPPPASMRRLPPPASMSRGTLSLPTACSARALAGATLPRPAGPPVASAASAAIFSLVALSDGTTSPL